VRAARREGGVTEQMIVECSFDSIWMSGRSIEETLLGLMTIFLLE
jgi:hypothetical protein